MTAKIAIIGGGISGLAAAHRLVELNEEAQKKVDLILYDKSSRLGGTICSVSRDGFLIEHGPDSFISEKPAGLKLATRLGLQPLIIGTQSSNRKSFVVKGGKLLSVPNGFYLMAPTDAVEFIRSPILSFAGRCRALAEFLIPGKTTIDDESIGSFVRRRFGQELLDRIAQPMLAGIYTGDPEKISLRATMPRFLELEKKYGSVIKGLILTMQQTNTPEKNASGPRYDLFLSFKNGMETLTKTLQNRLPADVLRSSCDINTVSYDANNKKWKITSAQGVDEADSVIMTASSRAASFLLKAIDPSFAELLNRLQFESVATINFAYNRDQISHALNGFGFVVPQSENLSLIACSFSSKKYAHRAPDGKVLLRAFVGGVFGRRIYERFDKSLVSAVQFDLSRLLGISGDPIFAEITRFPYAMVQYEVSHLDWVKQIEEANAKFPTLYLTGSSYRGVGISDCVLDAERVAEEAFRKS